MNEKQRMVEQFRQWLCDAFINLVTKENSQDISITEIARAAELLRKTFYHSFKNKEAVTNYLYDQLFDQYFKQLLQREPQVGEMTLKTTFDIFLNFQWQGQDLIRSLIRQDLFSHVNEIWQQKAVPRYQRFAAPWHVQDTPTQVNYVMAFQPGGLTNVLRVWLGQGNPEPPEQIRDVMLLTARQLTDSLDANQTQLQQTISS